MPPIEHQVILDVGYTDSKKNTHRKLTFGHRPLGRDLFEVERLSRNEADNIAALFKAAAVRFGELNHVSLNAFLSLDLLDRELVDEGYQIFLRASREGRAAEFIDAATVKLAFGYVRDGITYNRVTFGNMTTGWDEVNAERRSHLAIERSCYLLGCEITSFSSEDGSQVLETPLAMSIFAELDMDDILALKEASDRWQEHLRAERTLARQQDDQEQPATETIN